MWELKVRGAPPEADVLAWVDAFKKQCEWASLFPANTAAAGDAEAGASDSEPATAGAAEADI